MAHVDKTCPSCGQALEASIIADVLCPRCRKVAMGESAQAMAALMQMEVVRREAFVGLLLQELRKTAAEWKKFNVETPRAEFSDGLEAGVQNCGDGLLKMLDLWERERRKQP